MREIKFRAWDVKNSQMSWPFTLHETPTWETRSGGYTLSDEEFTQAPIMQYTGLKDKDGKEIYEGDVVQCLSGWWPGVVSTQSEGYMGWCIEPLLENRHRGRYGMNWDYDFEVIGNKWDNPELLKDKT